MRHRNHSIRSLSTVNLKVIETLSSNPPVHATIVKLYNPLALCAMHHHSLLPRTAGWYANLKQHQREFCLPVAPSPDFLPIINFDLNDDEAIARYNGVALKTHHQQPVVHEGLLLLRGLCCRELPGWGGQLRQLIEGLGKDGRLKSEDGKFKFDLGWTCCKPPVR